jgi:maltose-binding protein MalE
MRLLVLTLVLAASACAPAEEAPPPPGQPVEIRIDHQKDGAERAFFEQVVDEYNAAQDSVRVRILYRETEELRNLFVIASVGGKGPDLIFGPSDNVSTLALTESILPLDQVLPAGYLSEFDETGVLRWEGEPWMIADQVGNHLAFVYNKDLLPSVPETWEELIPTLQQIARDERCGRNDDRRVYGLTWNYTEPFFFVPFLTGQGGWMMTDQGTPTLDTDATARAVEFVVALRDEYQLIPGEVDYNVAETQFKEGCAAAIINGPWAWSGYADAGIDYGIARIPKVGATDQWSAPVVSSKGYSVNVNTPQWKQPYVRDLLVYLTDADMQARMARDLATIPTRPDVIGSDVVRDNPILQASLRQVEVGRAMPITPEMRQVWDGMRGPYQLVMNGQLSPREGAALMQQEVEKRIADSAL